MTSRYFSRFAPFPQSRAVWSIYRIHFTSTQTFRPLLVLCLALACSQMLKQQLENCAAGMVPSTATSTAPAAQSQQVRACSHEIDELYRITSEPVKPSVSPRRLTFSLADYYSLRSGLVRSLDSQLQPNKENAKQAPQPLAKSRRASAPGNKSGKPAGRKTTVTVAWHARASQSDIKLTKSWDHTKFGPKVKLSRSTGAIGWLISKIL